MSNLKTKLANRMLQNQLEDFLDDYGIGERDLSVAFEHFCNYCMFSLNAPEVYHSDSLFHDAVHTGKSGDCAIDGIMILVNDEPVTTLQEAREALKQKKGFTAKFYFVQAKTSDNFNSAEMLNFGYGVKSFFEDDDLNANQQIKDYKEIADYIFDNSINFQENPTCSLYYVTTGKWVGDDHLTKIVDDEKRQLEQLNYFSAVDYLPIDLNRLMTLYKDSDRLYYERRTHEYDDQPGLQRKNIVTLTTQLKSYMSMFMGEPHSMMRYYGELLKNNKDRLFQPDHKLIAYYTAAKTLHCVDRAMAAGVIDMKKWKPYRYHILLIVQTILSKWRGLKAPLRPNSREMERLCNSILEVADDRNMMTAVLHTCADILEKTLREYRGPVGNGTGPNLTKEFTMAMLANTDVKIEEINKKAAALKNG